MVQQQRSNTNVFELKEKEYEYQTTDALCAVRFHREQHPFVYYFLAPLLHNNNNK